MGRPATLRVDIVTNDRGASRGISNTESRLGKFGSRAKKVGAFAAKGLAVVGVAAIGAGVAVAKSASRQEQAYGALDSIYGKSAKRVKAWAKTSADSVGLARSEYAELSSVIGAQLKGMGFATDKAAGKSNKLITVGADLAATFGGSVSDAVGAVSSLLKGERDPIERYGVSIKQADVNARLAKLGLDGLTGAAAKQAEAQATLSLLNEQTASSTGQFRRESKSLAGQQERLKAKFENVKATVGAKLTPILAKLFGWISDKLIPGAAKLGRWLSAKLGPTFTRLGAWARTKLIPALRELFRWFMDKIYPNLKRSVMPILSGVKNAFKNVSSAINDNRQTISRLVSIAKFMVRAMGPVRRVIGFTLGLAFRIAGRAVGNLIRLIGGIVDVGYRAADAISWLIDKLSWLRNLNPGAIIGKLGSIFSTPVHMMVSPVTRGLPGLTAPGGGLSLSALNLAAAGPSPLDLTRSAAAAQPYIDARDLSTTVTVDGALDPNAVARQIEKILERRDRRLGRQR